MVDTARVLVDDLPKLVPDFGPDVVAIDAPPGWASAGRSRLTERELRWFGIQCFNTPSDSRMAEHPFYEWMTIGFAAFAAIDEPFPRYRGGSVKGTAIEVFPHASAVVLAGCLPPKGPSPHAWRRGVTSEASRSGLRSRPGRRGPRGAHRAVRARAALQRPRRPEGGTDRGAIGHAAPPYRRGESPKPAAAAALPGLAACGCGSPCTALTARSSRRHDAKRKSALWGLARSGQEAVDELQRRGWAIQMR